MSRLVRNTPGRGPLNASRKVARWDSPCRSIRLALAVYLGQHFSHAAVQDRQHLLNLLGGRDQRRAEGDPVRIEAEEQTVLQCSPADADADGQVIGEALFRRGVLDEFDSLKQALAAEVADDAMLLRQALEAGTEPLALHARVAA